MTVNKSTFITTSIAVHSQQEVDDFIDFINSSKEFADATHNMVVYRYYAPDNSLVEGEDDDGEHGAGTKILFLMQKMKVVNRVAICSRFWGGVLLGPARFKIINENIQECFKLARDKGELEYEK